MECRYHLAKYAGKASRLSCPQCERPHCLTHPYVDNADQLIDKTVGRCAHESSCGHRESNKLANCLYKAVEKHLKGHYIRKDWTDGDPDFEAPFYILKYTYCAAVLTENGFMGNELSLEFLESEEGKKAIVALHVEGIIDYAKGHETSAANKNKKLLFWTIFHPCH